MEFFSKLSHFVVSGRTYRRSRAPTSSSPRVRSCNHWSEHFRNSLPIRMLHVRIFLRLWLCCLWLHRFTSAVFNSPSSRGCLVAQVALSETPATENAAPERGHQPAQPSACVVSAVTGSTSDGARTNSSALAKCPLSPPRPRTRTVRESSCALDAVSCRSFVMPHAVVSSVWYFCTAVCLPRAFGGYIR